MTSNNTTSPEAEMLDEIADLEEYARQGKRPPLCKAYRIRVNRKIIVIRDANPTGKEILVAAEFIPPDEHTLRMKIRGGRPEKIGLDQHVDLTAPGIEKFKVLPRDQTEG